jgi:hypothetical protein
MSAEKEQAAASYAEPGSSEDVEDTASRDRLLDKSYERKVLK